MARRRGIPLRITEAAIDRYGPMDLAYWGFIKHTTRRSGGIVYRSYTESRAAKFGWSRSKFFQVMQRLVERGLAVKQENGNWKLATTTTVIGRFRGKEVEHKCTLLLPKNCTYQYVLDMLYLKRFEAGHRQSERFNTVMTPEQLFEAGKIGLKACGRLKRQRAQMPARNPIKGPLGSTLSDMQKLAQKGKVPMNTERLMKVIGLGRAALFAWKKRAKAHGWFEQENRTFGVPPELLPGLSVMYRDWERSCKGKFSLGRRVKFHQAAVYKLSLKY